MSVAKWLDSWRQDAALALDFAQRGWGTRNIRNKSGRSKQRPYGWERGRREGDGTHDNDNEA